MDIPFQISVHLRSELNVFYFFSKSKACWQHVATAVLDSWYIVQEFRGAKSKVSNISLVVRAKNLNLISLTISPKGTAFVCVYSYFSKY